LYINNIKGDEIMDLQLITLPSLKDFTAYHSIIPPIDNWWWLKTSVSYAHTLVHTVTKGNLVDARGCDLRSGGIRPLIIFTADIADSAFWCKPGAVFSYMGYQWILLDTNSVRMFALCNDIIGTHRFDAESNNWKTSELKKWLQTKYMKKFNK
jgi:hypothetical protein